MLHMNEWTWLDSLCLYLLLRYSAAVSSTICRRNTMMNKTRKSKELPLLSLFCSSLYCNWIFIVPLASRDFSLFGKFGGIHRLIAWNCSSTFCFSINYCSLKPSRHHGGFHQPIASCWHVRLKNIVFEPWWSCFNEKNWWWPCWSTCCYRSDEEDDYIQADHHCYEAERES